MGTLSNFSFFSGVGGLDLGSRMAGGIRTVGYCEFDRYAQGVLRSRIADGGLDDAPIWDDVTTFDGKPWRGVDIVSGGFPCQDVSSAGQRRGIEPGTRSGLFYEIMRVCSEMGPRFILLENVRGLLVYPGAHRVFAKLACMGYDAKFRVIRASSVGAPIPRARVWIVAWSNKDRRNRPQVQGFIKSAGNVGEAWNLDRPGFTNGGETFWKGTAPIKMEGVFRKWGGSKPHVDRLVNGLEFGLDRVERAGNGVVPQQSIPAWEEIKRLARII